MPTAFERANRLRAWIQVEDGKIVDAGYLGGAAVMSCAQALR